MSLLAKARFWNFNLFSTRSNSPFILAGRAIHLSMDNPQVESNLSKVSLNDGTGEITRQLANISFSSEKTGEIHTEKEKVKSTKCRNPPRRVIVTKQIDKEGGSRKTENITRPSSKPANKSYGKTNSTKLVFKCLTTKTDLHKNLLILDLNGTLLVRNKQTKAIYLRPFVPEFVDFILENFSVLVWSSAMPDNVNRMVLHVFQQRHSLLINAWNRTHLRLSQSNYYRKVKVVKDLSWVWEKYPHWNSTNTILIDDSEHKGQLQPHNHICLREFVKGDENDKELLNVKSYLEDILNADTNDIREYIRTKIYEPAAIASSSTET
ncbi:hypothetical protein K7432_003972 [Basidiobolus ranarum]|uniref:Mitochondrial import inner membrane translocase subunit TIM50 n=1 Tax=Basidiobolus ranarum TaxID=34480 RepID=A0ABR2WZ03_9FUNG